MRIIYFSLDYTPHDHRFLSALAETAHQVFYVRLLRGPVQTEARPVPERIEQVPWEGSRKMFRWRDVPGYVRGLRRVIRRLQPDLIHAGPIQTCAFIAALSGFRPLLTMSWGFDLMKDDTRNRWWTWVTRYTLRRSTFFASDARVTRDKAVAYGMKADRTVVFPWGVDLSHFAPGEEPEGAQDSFTLFCNRSWEPNYGVDVVARAFIQAARQREQLSLMLLGGGSQAAALRGLLLRSGVEERVTTPGFINNHDLPRFYHMADLFISASHVDGSSVSLMEALACGVPCAVSDIPANREWVTDGVEGWVFPDGNVDALAGIILKAAEQRSSLPAFGRRARRTAEEKADWGRNFSRLLEAYAEACRLVKVS